MKIILLERPSLLESDYFNKAYKHSASVSLINGNFFNFGRNNFLYHRGLRNRNFSIIDSFSQTSTSPFCITFDYFFPKIFKSHKQNLANFLEQYINLLQYSYISYSTRITHGFVSLNALLVKHCNDFLEKRSSGRSRAEVTYFSVGNIFS